MTVQPGQALARQSLFADQVTDTLERAAACGFPLFLQPIAASNPKNSSPFIAKFEDLERIFVSPERQTLLASLKRLLADLETAGNQPCMLLLGGSLLQRAYKPKDLDALLLCAEGPGLSDAIRLIETYKSSGLDLRIYPIDGNPLMVVKMVSFFSILYASNRQGSEKECSGLLLVDLSSERCDR